MATTSYIFRAASPELLISDAASPADASGTAVAADAAGRAISALGPALKARQKSKGA